MNVIRSNESAFSNRDSRDYQGQQMNGGTISNNGTAAGSLKKNPDLMAPKYNNSEQQQSHKYPNYIEELLLNSQQQFSYDNATAKGGPSHSNQRNRESRDRSMNKIGADQVSQYTNSALINNGGSGTAQGSGQRYDMYLGRSS